MSDHIPIEIITNILDRITGIKDLVRWRRVSKQWLALIDSHDFIQRHLRKATSSNLGLFVNTGSQCTLYLPENKPQLSYRGGGKLIGTCDGLICFWMNSDFQPHILNPSTGERRYLRTHVMDHSMLLGYGFGYDQSSDDYKVMRFFPGIMEIHSVRGRSSREHNVPFGDCFTRPEGMFARGALYWLVNETDRHLYALNLATETASSLQLPAEIDYPFRTVTVGEVGSRLSLFLLYKYPYRVDVWVMKEQGKEESWNKAYNINLRFVHGEIDCVFLLRCSSRSNGGRILFLFEGRELMWLDLLSYRVGYLEISNVNYEHGYTLDAFYCLDTLVKICPTSEV